MYYCVGMSVLATNRQELSRYLFIITRTIALSYYKTHNTLESPTKVIGPDSSCRCCASPARFTLNSLVSLL